MNSQQKYKRGSAWRKWDLHVHTPDTKLNYQKYETEDGSDKWDKFCNIIESSDVSVFGITDYFSIDNYFTFIEKFRIKYPTSKKVFFPNVEFRFEPKNKADEHIQLHIIFSNDEKTLSKIQNFLDGLELLSENEDGTSLFCKKDDLEKIEYAKAMIKGSVKEFRRSIAKYIPDNKYLIIGLSRGYGSCRPNGKGDGRGAEYAKELDKVCDAFFGKSEDTKFFLNEEKGRGELSLSPKPVLFGCDAHSFEDLSKKLGKYFEEKNNENEIVDYAEITWVKSDPTFEGLRQIIYEPKERVRIQKDNPGFEFDKPFFDNIEISEEINVFEDIQDVSQQVYFEKNTILLNKNLVTIIGGRGEGKSLLVNYFAHIFNKFNDVEDEFSKKHSFKIIYSKNNAETPDVSEFFGDADNELDFLFIPQNKLKNLSEKKKLGQEIKKLLNLEDLCFSDDLNKEIRSTLNRIKDINSWFYDRDEDGDLHHNKEFVEKFKSKNEKLLKSITTKENKDKLERYTSNVKRIRNLESLILRLNSFKELLLNTGERLESERVELNKNFIDENIISKFDLSNQINQITKNVEQCKAEKSKKEAENSSIKKQFESSGFSGDLSSLLNSAEDYQRNVEWAEEKLKEINDKRIKLENLLKSRNEVGKKMKEEYERQETIITETWTKIIDKIDNEDHKELMRTILSDRDISILGEIIFDRDIFYSKLKDYIDLRSFASVKEDINITDVSGFVDFIEKKLSTYLEGDKNEKTKNDLSELFFDLQQRKEFLYVQPRVTYKGKPLYRLSIGQRGTVYLCLKLATGAFSKPIIFDQPEDDLDNEFITSELIDIFKKLKKYRQIIILTHNANLVVNSDAEQVIVAKNDEEKLKYFSGSLENKKIIDSVCQILEGGAIAFEQRKRKYNLK